MSTKPLVHHLLLIGIFTCIVLVLTVDAYNLYNKQFQRYDREDENRLYTAQEIGLDEDELLNEIGSYRHLDDDRLSTAIYKSQELEDLELKLSRTCGQRFVSYLSDGRNAKLGEFPSFVFMVNYEGFVGQPVYERSTCGGAILDEYHVLTAAHCIADNWLTGYAQPVVDLPKPIFNLSHRMKTYCRHPDYKIEQENSPDIAVIRMKDPFKFNHDVQSACLPVFNYAAEDGGEAIVHQIGMGVIEEGTPNNRYPEKLRALPVDKTTCPAGVHSETYICFEGKDPQYAGNICEGDSGSPVIAYQESRETVVAVAQSTPTSAHCRKGLKGVSINVNTFNLKNDILKLYLCTDEKAGKRYERDELL